MIDTLQILKEKGELTNLDMLKSAVDTAEKLKSAKAELICKTVKI